MRHLFTINHFFWKHRWRFLLGIVFIILTNYFRILSPQLTGYVVNAVVKKAASATAVAGDIKSNNDIIVQFIISKLESKAFSEKIVWSGIILLVLALISGFFMFLMRQTIIVMSRLIEYDQKNQVFAHYQQLDAGFYKTHSTGDLMNRISEDVSRVRMYTGPAIMYFINLAAVLGFSIFFMLKASPKLTLVALSPLPLLAITIYFVNTIINKKSERVQSLLSSLTTNAQESYSGIRVIKSFVQEKAMLGFFTANSDAYKRNALGLAKTEAIYFPSMALLIGISTLLTIMVGGMDVLHDPVNNKVGTIAEFVMYIQMLTFPVSAIGWTASMTQRAAASQKRINEFLQTEPTIKNSQTPLHATLKGAIDFTNVDFTYSHTGIHAINDFSFSIKPKEKIAIVGRTGSGKSTIAQLLLRMYDADNGLIQYDGVPINKLDIENLRSQISYVPQDIFLFSETISNNIRFGLDSATQEKIVTAASQANIHKEIQGFPLNYNTLVGERGVTLSGGQKQRISIARALIKNSPIVIFDDCLSAVDAKTEKEILNTLNHYMQDKTAIIITHRIFSLLQFDKILVLDEGKIVETGTHYELLAKKGYYAEMYNRQQEQESAG
ncbi:ABC transporter ATP-binding protein/permease [Ferruginibacter lapsinanis]|uniref:ABC transporter ATP-binding protein n=1 Tax=Ferruginibacter lapsinanis TaxID=563172 RepID=UPI001E63A47E|nr:ABC transporter ATP-binding protein [Ferruginibacter lapsinanis]UEG49443.1 ABC transporter ATP-binding protein/permease [Ferruginibacter lapsinanis]